MFGRFFGSFRSTFFSPQFARNQKVFYSSQQGYPGGPNVVPPSTKKLLKQLLTASGFVGVAVVLFHSLDKNYAFYQTSKDPDNPPMPPPNLSCQDFVSFDISVEDNIVGSLVIGVYSSVSIFFALGKKTYVPRTSKNFLTFVNGKNGKGYEGTLFHRVQNGDLIQGGDIEFRNGKGGWSIYGKTLEDEIQGLGIRHEAGAVAMANCGRDSNASQFFICAEPCHWLDRKHVVFGKVVEGMDVVKKISNLETNSKGNPLQTCQIKNCRIVKTTTTT